MSGIINSQDFAVSRVVGEKLNSAYPGHLWAVDVTGGTVNIHNLACHGRWGFRLMLADIYSDPGLKSVVKAGGELLERYRLNRGKFKEDEWRNAPKDFTGQLVGDHG